MRSDCLHSSSQSRFSHFSPSKMESTEAWVLRSTSVSSSRRIMVPPLWRAYNQLKMNVRALPTCRNPVGDGAKRTRGLTVADGPLDDALCGKGLLEESVMRNLLRCYERWKTIVKQCTPCDLA